MNANSERKFVNAIGGKTARACDNCLRKRARWFCAADDAFLCQACDAMVHSANKLTRRHERVRLETSSLKGTINGSNSSIPSWHQGFTRKARSQRQPKPMKLQTPVNNPLPLVPEVNSDDTPIFEENEEQLLYRVPVFDPIADDFLGGDGIENLMLENEEAYNELDLDKLLKGDDELEVFATDVESLLGMGIDDDSACRINDLRMGAVDCEREENEVEGLLYCEKVKVKEEDGENEEVQAAIACHLDPSLDMEFNWDFNYASSMSTWEDDDEMKIVGGENKTTVNIGSESASQVERKMLRLNYEAVIAAWSTQGSPWTNGVRPQFDLEKFSIACMGGSCNQYGGDGGRSSVYDAGRQARVSRYREKRRTRLFAKKIRYEVRKLNAEKRPRMKGRFVKRTSLLGSSSLPNYFKNK